MKRTQAILSLILSLIVSPAFAVSEECNFSTNDRSLRQKVTGSIKITGEGSRLKATLRKTFPDAVPQMKEKLERPIIFKVVEQYVRTKDALLKDDPKKLAEVERRLNEAGIPPATFGILYEYSSNDPEVLTLAVARDAQNNYLGAVGYSANLGDLKCEK